MSKVIRIKRGLDINLKGKADKIYQRVERAETYAVKPTDFHGIRPKLVVKPGDEVKVGTALFFDKYNPDTQFTSPVAGKVKTINRGERRKILEVVIEPAPEDSYEEFKVEDPSSMSRDDVISVLKLSGLWPSILQRPYAVIADSSKMPKSIFISGFDSAPLAPDIDFIIKDHGEEFQKGLDVISKLTEGKVHLSLNADYPPCQTYSDARGVEKHYFQGPHPAGNPGIQIHHIDPVLKGDYVWYLGPLDVLRIGNLFTDGKVDNSTVVALTGSEVEKPVYYKMIRGAAVESILRNNLKKDGEKRIISGNVLTGTQISKVGHIGYYDHHVSVIPEGNHHEFIGWALPGLSKYSVSRSFFTWLMPKKEFELDTNLHGGKRAYVFTGEYNKVLPMDIFPVHLIKSIMYEDIDEMEKLGIYEVAEEDFALCEFVCTSKMDVQQILRKGLDLMKKETE
jgi:Na+-transporting NADH:ubiquinone oxidoreductase subunit A